LDDREALKEKEGTGRLCCAGVPPPVRTSSDERWC
jgi:hypothetical protein